MKIQSARSKTFAAQNLGRYTLLLLTALLVFELHEDFADAQERGSVSQAATGGSLRSSLIDGYDSPALGDFRFTGSIKSTNTAGRFEELDTENARRYRMKHEYAVGTLHTSGWGIMATAVTSGSISADPKSANNVGPGDPSLILSHPDYYRGDIVRVSGQIRRYFAVSDRSQNRGLEQYAYYLSTNFRLAHGWGGFSQLIPRYFFQNLYQGRDTKAVVDNYAAISNQMFSWMRLGVGSHVGMEWHAETPTGTVAEVFPFATFTVSRNFQIEPRLYFPIQRMNEVNESARSVSLNNAQAELYASITL
jgi:hypothetical protein